MVAGWAAIVAYGIYIAAGSPSGSTDFFDLFVYHVPLLAGALVCAIRAVRTPETRGIWAAFGLGIASWMVADLYYTLFIEDMRRIPYPSLADAFYLATLPCFFVGIGLMVRRRVGAFTSASWLDGAIAALAFACVGAALLAPALVGLSDGDPAAVATNFAYPVGDLILLAFLVGALTVGGVKNSSSLIAVAAGLVIWTGVDATYLYLVATDSYAGGWIDLLWPAGALVIATGAVSSSKLSLGQAREHQASVAVPVIAALAAICVLMLDHFDRVSTEAIWLGGATLVAVAVRLLISSNENRRLVKALSRDSITDPLTGLGNRRRLADELDRLIAEEIPGSYVAMFDLDGFKAYNDAFGHSLGDALLRTLGFRLQDAARPVGSAYRLGGDEFCVLIEAWEGDPSPAVDGLRRALCEKGDSFDIGASCGLVRLGHEAKSANEALRLADQRMYADKGDRSRRNQHREAHDVLLSVLREHEPALEQHVEGVGGMARAVARRLGLEADEVETIARAAELHDIGKVAIPDSILRKPGPLTEDEWALMREHTMIGQRILAVVPAMRKVGALIRASHERWDGNGYPDGLVGDGIPLGARVIFVCDAFDAMTENRPYQRSKTMEQAAEELRRNAGSQFDRRVVEAFCEVLADQGTREIEHRPVPAAYLAGSDSA